MFEHTARWYDTGEYLSDDGGCESDYDITECGRTQKHKEILKKYTE